jgi:predicted sulfurtransferase
MICCNLSTPYRVDEACVELRCPIHGTRYAFLFNNQLETQHDRQERLKNEHVCDDCGTEYSAIRPSTTGNLVKLCPTCLDKRRKAANLRSAEAARKRRSSAKPKTHTERVCTAWL